MGMALLRAKTAAKRLSSGIGRKISGEIAMKSKDIIAIFSERGLLLDVQEANGQGYCDEAFLARWKDAPGTALFYFGFEGPDANMSQSLSFVHSICREFVTALSRDPDLEITKSAPLPDSEFLHRQMEGIPFAVGAEYIGTGWLMHFWERLSEAFAQELAAWEGGAADFLRTHSARLNIAGRVFFHLVESKSEDYPFAFLATYSTKSEDGKKATHLPLKNALLEYKGDQGTLIALLAAVTKAAEKSDFISELMELGELFSPLQFKASEAYVFLREIPLYEECGIICRMPDWWKRKSAGVSVSISIGDRTPAVVGIGALLDFTPRLLWDGSELTREEAEALLAQTEGLSFLKGKWIEVNHEKLKKALAAYEGAMSMEGMPLAEAMRLELGLSKEAGRFSGDSVEIARGEWLKNLAGNLQRHKGFKAANPSAHFKAALRHYQADGFRWLLAMREMRFGALLADDMGLGKTLQILAMLDYIKQHEGIHALLVIPASLIGNWTREIDRFAPNISYAILHSKHAALGSENLCITTYGMASRIEALKQQMWDLLIIDEAQAIKNPGAAQSKAVKQIKSAFRIAMTGTPIENRLSDLWSLFDFLNPGLLGTPKEFSGIAKEASSSGSYAKLRSVVSPFILRRLKTDASIISDLPDKIEIKEYAALKPKQAALYKGLVDNMQEALESADGIGRKGMVLAAITKFKQICNHPDQYLGQAGYSHAASGKYDKLREICETIYEKREKVLVFTQFKEMAEPLSIFLGDVFEREGLILHGGTPVKKRGALVERFNSGEYVPFMVLSLKAGGVGLNLTAANHVVHFDRWWNPAVENQATDRAFRIGQTKNVMVHKLISEGTIEEKIDQMIEGKQKLAGGVIAASGEKWITEMSNEELMRLFAWEG
jgi:non-specific serine/threonine protein kinase